MMLIFVKTPEEQNMLIDFSWEAVGQRSTGWWWQKHSWKEWRQVVTAGKSGGRWSQQEFDYLKGVPSL